MNFLKFLFKKIYYGWQKYKKGFCDLDVENFDSWFFDIMGKILEEKSINSHGSLRYDFKENAEKAKYSNSKNFKRIALTIEEKINEENAINYAVLKNKKEFLNWLVNYLYF